MFKRLLPVGLTIAVLVLLIAPTATAKPTSSRDYCVVHIVGQKATGQFELSKESCYSTQAEALATEAPAAVSHSGGSVGLLSSGIGIHCDGYDLGAPCLTVVGDGCTGGFINLDAFWTNRISSTQHGCPLIGHYDLANLSGSSHVTNGAWPTYRNLTTFNNATSSIVYYY